MAGMGNSRHLETGSKRPAPPKKDVLRVYGMKFCPFVHRLKLVLAAKNIKHETVNINLSKKPEWYADINPGQKVPSLEINGGILYESDITSHYVDEVYPGRKLTTSDPFKRAKENMLLGHYGPAISGFYGVVFAKDEEARAAGLSKIKTGLKALSSFLQDKQYLCGNQPGMTDYMIWPHLERIKLQTPSVVDEAGLQGYTGRMEKDEAVKACRHPAETLQLFFDGYKTGNPNYDVGTVEESPGY